MKTLSLNVVALYTWFLGPMPYGCDNIGSYHSFSGKKRFLRREALVSVSL